MSKAGKAAEGGVNIGSQHPLPENIPHLTSPSLNNGGNGNNNGGANGGSVPGATSGSPVKESSFLQRETSADEPNVLSPASPKSPDGKGAVSPPPVKEGVPVRWQS